MPFDIIAISGSLRKDSYNTRLLDVLAAVAPEDVRIQRFAYADIPLYNAELEQEVPPVSVTRLREALRACDALVVATPEYNHSIPGVLKNAIDWASRPAYHSSLLGVPAGMISASPGAVGGARAQAHLKTVLLAAGAHVMPAPEFAMGHAESHWSATGALNDESTERLRRWIERFAAWAALQPGRASRAS